MNLEQWQRSKKIKAEAEAAAKRTAERVLNAVKEPVMSEFKIGDKALFPVRLGNSVEWCEGRISAYRSDMNKFDLCGVRHWGWYFAHELRPVTSDEVEAVHRTDKTIGTLEELHPEFSKVLHENFLELLGDDAHIENHISPHCQSKDV
ncbi:TPA: hypothetical protein ACGAPI_000063 [Acinetobacter baumannii]